MTIRRIPPIAVSRSAAAEIARSHGIEGADLQPLPSTGIINSVYALGDDYVLRVPNDHPLHIAQALARQRRSRSPSRPASGRPAWSPSTTRFRFCRFRS